MQIKENAALSTLNAAALSLVHKLFEGQLSTHVREAYWLPRRLNNSYFQIIQPKTRRPKKTPSLVLINLLKNRVGMQMPSQPLDGNSSPSNMKDWRFLSMNHNRENKTGMC